MLTIARPDDCHLHLRDGAWLAHTVAASAAWCGRAVVMPNLSPPVTGKEEVEAYRRRILAARPANSDFTPLMTLYLTDKTAPQDIRAAADLICGVKLYPAGATTHAAAGVRHIEALDPVLEELTRLDLPLLVHGETVDPETDIYDREQRFIDRHLRGIVERHPKLRVVVEHITTREAVAFVRDHGPHLAATITPQHLRYTRNDLLAGGLRPHFYCAPILKRAAHRNALQEIVAAGHRRFFLGTDSAPHPRREKESACGCAGCYSAPTALALYADTFEALGILDRLAGFAAHFGADFYRLERNEEKLELERRPWTVPERYFFGDDEIIPLGAGERLNWCLRECPAKSRATGGGSG